MFQTLIQSHTIQEFIKMGWLSDFDYVTAEPDNPILKQVAGLKKRSVDGDYQTKAMAMDCEESIENLYEAYRKFVNGKKGIVYAIVDDLFAREVEEMLANVLRSQNTSKECVELVKREIADIKKMEAYDDYCLSFFDNVHEAIEFRLADAEVYLAVINKQIAMHTPEYKRDVDSGTFEYT